VEKFLEIQNMDSSLLALLRWAILFTIDPKTSPSDRGLVIFPAELFRLIIQHLSEDPQALCAISLVCGILQEEGQRQSYRRMISPRGTGTHIKILKSILDTNRLALLVHEYTQECIAYYQRGPLWGYLCRGLQTMVNQGLEIPRHGWSILRGDFKRVYPSASVLGLGKS
jgi:hypothetical protein